MGNDSTMRGVSIALLAYIGGYITHLWQARQQRALDKRKTRTALSTLNQLVKDEVRQGVWDADETRR